MAMQSLLFQRLLQHLSSHDHLPPSARRLQRAPATAGHELAMRSFSASSGLWLDLKPLTWKAQGAFTCMYISEPSIAFNSQLSGSEYRPSSQHRCKRCLKFKIFKEVSQIAQEHRRAAAPKQALQVNGAPQQFSALA